jgi:hypothetical protein
MRSYLRFVKKSVVQSPVETLAQGLVVLAHAAICFTAYALLGAAPIVLAVYVPSTILTLSALMNIEQTKACWS